MYIGVRLKNSKRETVKQLDELLDMYDARIECLDKRTKKELTEVFHDAKRADAIKSYFRIDVPDLRNADSLLESLQCAEMSSLVIDADLISEAPERRNDTIVKPPFKKLNM